MSSGKDRRKDQGSNSPWLMVLALLVLVFGPSVVSGAESGLLPPPKKEAREPSQATPTAPPSKCKGPIRPCVTRYVRSGRIQFTTSVGCNPRKDFQSFNSMSPQMWNGLYEMATRTGGVLVTCIKTGHSYYVAGTTNVSNHTVGQAFDVGAVKRRAGGHWVDINKSMQYGNGRDLMITLIRSCTDTGASEAITLLSLGGASFAMSNHSGHIHCGW